MNMDPKEAAQLLQDMYKDLRYQLYSLNNDLTMRKVDKITNSSLYRRRMHALDMCITLLQREKQK